MPTLTTTAPNPVAQTAAATTLAVRFVEPLPGFEDLKTFTLAPVDPDGLLLALRCAADPELRFVLTPARVFFPDYAPRLGDGVAAALGASAEDELDILLVLTLGRGLADARANLRAPIALAPATGAAMQVLLDDESLSLRQPILPDTPAG